MKKYLIDTNIAVFYMRDKYPILQKKFADLSSESCFISEITLAELKFGVEKSINSEKNKKVLANFLSGV